MIDEPDAARKKTMLRSEASFNLWQSILRGAGVITGCRRCADDLPGGRGLRADAEGRCRGDSENTPAKEARLAAMTKGDASPAYRREVHWVGRMNGGGTIHEGAPEFGDGALIN